MLVKIRLQLCHAMVVELICSGRRCWSERRSIDAQQRHCPKQTNVHVSSNPPRFSSKMITRDVKSNPGVYV